MRVMLTLVVGLTALNLGCSSLQWRHAGSTIVVDESQAGFELVQRGGPADKSGEWGPVQTTFRRIDGHSGRVIAQSQTVVQLQPQPDFVFGWRGEYVVYDIDAGTLVRSADSVSKRGRHLELQSGLALLRRYPSPLFGPSKSAGPFELYAANLDRMTLRTIEIPQAASQLGVFDDLVVVRDQMSLTAYSLQGERMWRRPTLTGEQLTEPLCRPDQTTRPRVGSPLLATVARSSEEDTASVIVRDARTGEVEWRRDFAGLHPNNCLTLGPWVVFVATAEVSRTVQGQRLTDHRRMWWLWDRGGKEITTGSEPVWRAAYAFQGGAAATQVNVAFDRDSHGVVVGCGLDAVFVQGNQVSRLHRIPGEPLLLRGRTLVCRSERGHFAVLLK